MAAPTLLVSAAACLVAAAAFLLVARRLSRREVGPHDRLALALFVAWWAGLALCALLEALLDALAFLGLLTSPLLATARLVTLLALCVSLWGLLYYLAYVLTGKRRLVGWIGGAYALVYVVTLYVLAGSGPPAPVPGAWSVDADYPSPGGPRDLAEALLFLPPVVAALAYALLAFRLEGAARWRVAALGASVALVFSTVFLAERLAGEAWAMLARLPLAMLMGAAAVVVHLRPKGPSGGR